MRISSHESRVKSSDELSRFGGVEESRKYKNQYGFDDGHLAHKAQLVKCLKILQIVLSPNFFHSYYWHMRKKSITCKSTFMANGLI